ncbi:hypothetical protein MRA01_55130 [Methylobacterium radiotolerans]|nr:hypothetical protein MRA01_55130 [Methylobacterium radiotolerans]
MDRDADPVSVSVFRREGAGDLLRGVAEGTASEAGHIDPDEGSAVSTSGQVAEEAEKAAARLISRTEAARTDGLSGGGGSGIVSEGASQRTAFTTGIATELCPEGSETQRIWCGQRRPGIGIGPGRNERRASARPPTG